MHAIRAVAAAVSTVLVAWRAPADTCSLLTQTEASSVLGLPLLAGVHGGAPQNCSWVESPGPNFTNKRIDLTLLDANGFDIGKTPVPKMTKTPVSGIGDDAYYSEGYTLTSLSVKKGNTAFVILVKFGTWSTDQRKAMEKTLAQDILARL
jgi:hypothetical protein